MDIQNPLIVQSDKTLLLEVNNPRFRDARDTVNLFAHLVKSPEHIHTYEITPLSLWNAAALGMTPEKTVEALKKYSKYPIPGNIDDEIRELMGRFGHLSIQSTPEGLVLKAATNLILPNLSRNPKLVGLLGERIDDQTFRIPPANRGVLKQTLMGLGYPADDRAGYVDGEPFDIAIRPVRKSGETMELREYQMLAAESFVGNRNAPGGSGVVVLPCGAGKTIVGLAAMDLLNRKTLILVTNITAARQWRREILDKTTLRDEDIGEYSGECKDIRPVTLATYQILTYRRKKTDSFMHFGIFNSENWGLIIYDEVHLLPAPVFKFTADLQARRRLGLTATLIREDGLENDVFALIGPKKFDVPWKDLERQGWIATVTCIEIRIDLPHAEKMRYLALPPRRQIRLAYENPFKISVIRELLEKHRKEQVLIIGQYLTQIREIADEFKLPLITGTTPNNKRDELYDKFRERQISALIVSKVGNFAIDLPDANIAIQVSGSFGSRQEEAQRLGRILRPKKNGEQAIFYSVVTRESKELDFAMKRQLFLAEQGYSYDIQYREFE